MSTPCEECGKVHRIGGGYFKTHDDWLRWKRNRATSTPGVIRFQDTRTRSEAKTRRNLGGLTREEYFEKHVERTDSCWWWNAPLGSSWHRWAYEHFVGPIPVGLTLDHLCGNGYKLARSGGGRLCVNPHHMDPCTIHENASRGSGPHFELRGR